MRSTKITATVLGALLVGGPAFAPPATAADDRPTAIVSLGDSAISGEGAGSYEAGTRGENGNWCHRSTNALVHKTTVATRTINLACSGADSANVSLADTTHYTEGSQSRRLISVAQQYRVTTVIVQIGANDEPAFADTMLDCIERVVQPVRLRLPLQAPHPVATAPGRHGAARRDRARRRPSPRCPRPATPTAPTTWSSPRTPPRSPSAWTPPCTARRAARSNWPTRRYGRTEAVPQFSTALRGAADRSGAKFLDFSRATEGQEACSGYGNSSTEWQNRITVDPWAWVTGGLDAIGIHMAQESFHPNARVTRSSAGASPSS